MSDLTNRLRGQYSVGPQGEFGTRSFSHFTPPICLEAAERIEALEKELENIANAKPRSWDDPTEFTPWAQSRARHALNKS